MNELYEQRKFIYLFLAILAAICLFYIIKTAEFEGVKESEGAQYAYIHISGCVREEGWYVEKSEVIDLYELIEDAGVSSSADLSEIPKELNKSELNKTAQGYYYFTVVLRSPIVKNYVDLNLCGKEELIEIGLSDMTAEKILNYRTVNGQFKNKKELTEKQLLSPEEYGMICYSVFTFTDEYGIF